MRIFLTRGYKENSSVLIKKDLQRTVIKAIRRLNDVSLSLPRL
jgi:hypothetical protein